MIKKFLFSLVAIALLSLAGCQSGTQSEIAEPIATEPPTPMVTSTASETPTPTVIPKENITPAQSVTQEETASTTPKATPPTPTAPADITPTGTPTPTVVVTPTSTPTPDPEAVLVTVVPKGEVTVQVEDETLIVNFDEEGRLDSVQQSDAQGRKGLRSYVYWGGTEYDYYINYFYVESKCDMSVQNAFYPDGTPLSERVTGRYGSFGYFEMLSKNADGTVTLEYKIAPQDRVEINYYYDNGNLESWDKRWYEPLEEDEMASADDVPLAREYMTYKEDGAPDKYTREESGHRVEEHLYSDEFWLCYEYYTNGMMKTYAMYLGEGTEKPLGAEKFAENGDVTESIQWEYNDNGSYVQKWLDMDLYGGDRAYIWKAVHYNADDTVSFWEETERDENAYVTASTTYLGEGTSRPQVVCDYGDFGVIQSKKLYCYGEGEELLRCNVISYDNEGYVASTDTTVYKPKEERPVPEVPEEGGAGSQGRLEETTVELLTAITDTEVYFDRFYSGVSQVSQFVTPDGYGVACHENHTFTIYLYSRNLVLYDTITILKDYNNLGAVTCDEEGNFYAVYGIDNLTEDLSKTVISIVKYSSDGKRLGSADYSAEETVYEVVHCVGDMETKYPFVGGNCSIAIQDGMLVCNHARQMRNGHQSNMVHYVNTETMEKLEIVPCYTSHSVDQQVIATKDGGFLLVDHGDGEPERAFMVNRFENGTSGWTNDGVAAFHFREGADRVNGYNETYAQLGGIAELPNAYILVGASERTLSLETSETGGRYCGYSEPRDLFIQYLKKDFTDHVKEMAWDSIGYTILKEGFAVGGATRTAVGTKPTDAKTQLFLRSNTEDYGVIWLTDYADDEMVYNPKVVTTETGEVILLWQKVLFDTKEVLDTYYMILDRYSAVLREPTSLGVVPLSTNESAVYLDGSVYWTVSEGTNVTSYRFVIPEVEEYSPEEDIRWRIFDASYYLEQHPELKETVGTDEKALYVYWTNVGVALGHAASPIFVPVEHMRLNRELAASLEGDYFALAEHFFNEGIYAGQRGSLEFDYAVYKEANPDLVGLLGDDVDGYYAHYVNYGRAEGRTASNGDTLPSTKEFTLVPEGTQTFITDDLIRVEVDFNEEGIMAFQRFYDANNKLLDKLEYTEMTYDPYRYIDRMNDDNSLTRVVDWQYTEDGVLLYKEVNASTQTLRFLELISENADGTVTVRLEELAKGNYYNEGYQAGILYSLVERKYNEAGECTAQLSYDIDTEGVRTITWETYYENGNVIDDTIYAGGIISMHSEYAYDAEGHLSQGANYYYDLDGNLNYYDIFTYSYNPQGDLFNRELLLTHKQYNGDDTLKEESRYEYYDNGMQKEMEKKTYKNGAVYQHYVYRYNTMGYETYYLYYRSGKFNTHKECEYYENGQLKWEAYYYDETTDNLKSLTEYDENGNRITS